MKKDSPYKPQLQSSSSPLPGIQIWSVGCLASLAPPLKLLRAASAIFNLIIACVHYNYELKYVFFFHDKGDHLCQKPSTLT